jgi:hypothetical protein
MSNLIHADVFFFVSTILLSLLVIVFIIVLVYLIRVLREARSVARLVREEAERLAGDLEAMREKIRTESFSLGNVFSLVVGFLKSKKKKGRAAQRRDN